MATIIKRGPYQYQAKVRRKGYPAQTKTFERKRDAQDWAATTEAEMRQGIFVDRSGLERTTLKQILQHYKKTEVEKYNSSVSLLARVKTWMKNPLADRYLASLTTMDFIDYSTERLEEVKPATVRRDLMVIASVFNIARYDFQLPIDNDILKPVFRRLTQGPARERRLSEEESVKLFEQAAIYSKEAIACVRLAIETGMRRGEIAQLQWSYIDLTKGTVELPATVTKNKQSRSVPLSLQAVAVLKELQPKKTGRVFKSFSRPDSITQFFSRICQRAGINDFCFHDLRHEAASRIAPHVTTAVLAKIMGWKSIQMAMRYYNPTAEELVTAIRGVAKASDTHNLSEALGAA